MKNLILTLISILSLNTFASNSSNISNNDLQTIENEFYSKAKQINELYSELHANEVIYQVENSFTEKRKEEVAAIRFFIWGDLRDEHHLALSVDTELVVKNKKEEREFERKVQKDNVGLNTKLQKYFNDNLNKIISLKILGAESLRNVVQLSAAGVSLDNELVKDIARKVNYIQFSALQTVTRCVKTEYSLLLRILEHYPHEIESCSTYENTLSISDYDKMFLVELGKLNKIVLSWSMAAQEAILFNFNEKDVRQPLMFNMPYFRN